MLLEGREDVQRVAKEILVTLAGIPAVREPIGIP
jgi:hypothetical protein